MVCVTEHVSDALPFQVQMAALERKLETLQRGGRLRLVSCRSGSCSPMMSRESPHSSPRFRVLSRASPSASPRWRTLSMTSLIRPIPIADNGYAEAARAMTASRKSSEVHAAEAERDSVAQRATTEAVAQTERRRWTEFDRQRLWAWPAVKKSTVLVGIGACDGNESIAELGFSAKGVIDAANLEWRRCKLENRIRKQLEVAKTAADEATEAIQETKQKLAGSASASTVQKAIAKTTFRKLTSSLRDLPHPSLTQKHISRNTPCPSLRDHGDHPYPALTSSGLPS